MTRPRRHTISDPSQLEALGSPIRAQIVGLMEGRDECSVREIAEHVGMQAESVYYHIHQLVRAGFLVRKGQRPATTRRESIYQLRYRPLYVDWNNRTPAYRSALKKAVRAAHRLAERVVEQSLDSDQCRFGGRTADARIQQESARLSKEKLRELIGMLIEIDRFVIENNEPDQDTTYLVTASISPVLRNQK